MGGFDGWKRNDMYKILIEKQVADMEDFEQPSPVEQIDNDYTSEYFEQMELLKWYQIEPKGNVYTPRTGHEVV